MASEEYCPRCSRRTALPPHESRDDEDIGDFTAAENGDGNERLDDEVDAKEPPQNSETEQQDPPERPRTPAYVAPIPKIAAIPQISPATQISTTERPQLSPLIGSLLVGKTVDEYGDIIDEKTGTVLAHAAGDLPSLVGRKVSNSMGDILGDSGELLGYVTDVETGRGSSANLPPAPPAMPRSLFDMMGRSTASLMVDHLGNIIDANGNVVGKFHDNNNPLHRKEKEEREARERSTPGAEPHAGPPPPAHQPPEKPEDEQQEQERPRSPPSQGQPRPRRTEEERRQNAQAWRKENPSESPSDIFLDVKSTRDGIQLTIRIPTVFGQQCTPNITFS